MKSIPRRQALGLLGGLVASPALADRLSVAAAIDAVTGGATTRMRLARSQTVTLLAEKGDGRFHMAEAEVAVTVGGCEN